jgi:hypothetical protein
MLVVWALVQWFLRPPSVVEDWMGWRQADTMAIARNFVERPSGILWPRIDWGGAGPGFVEAELQLVPYLIAASSRVFGLVEWTGQLLSLILMTGTGALLVAFLRKRFGRGPALLGLGAWLANQGVVFVSTAVQPDTLSLFLSLVAVVGFVSYLDHARTRDLIVAGAATALAALVKPTALQLGVVEFVLVVLGQPRLLRTFRLWIMWALVLASVALLLLHARQLYLAYGNTFGILSGGDRKTPRLHHLLHARLYFTAAVNSLNWGIGWVGAAAGAWLLLRRRLERLEWALLCGSTVLVLVTLRYATNYYFASHYHLPTTLLGAVLVAHAASELPTWFRSSVAATCAVVLLALLFIRSERKHRAEIVAAGNDDTVRLGRVLAAKVSPDELVVVRSIADAWDDWWKTANNFEDPRVLYVAHTRGWVFSADNLEGGVLKPAVERGARWYVESAPHMPRPDFDRDLDARGELVHDDPSVGRIWRLNAHR